MAWIRLWITCTGMATHSCWSAWNNSSTFTGVFTLPQTHLSNSSQVYSTGSKLIWAHGRPGENLDIGVGEELCGISLLHGVWHCHVELQRHTTFEAKKYAFLFLNSILIYEQKNGTNAQTILLQNGKHICLHFSNSCMILNVTKTGINVLSLLVTVFIQIKETTSMTFKKMPIFSWAKNCINNLQVSHWKHVHDYVLKGNTQTLNPTG